MGAARKPDFATIRGPANPAAAEGSILSCSVSRAICRYCVSVSSLTVKHPATKVLTCRPTKAEGRATGISWLFYFKALQCGDVSKVAPIDKLSVALVVVFGIVFLHEKLSWQVIAGTLCIVAGTLFLLCGGR